MFNNFINAEDFRRFASSHIFSKAMRILLRVAIRGKAWTARAWARTQNPPCNWVDIPEVKQRINRMISGDPNVDYQEYIARKYLGQIAPSKGLSLCCGTGHREIGWARLGVFKTINAYDISSPRIEYAKAQARRYGLDKTLDFQVGDVISLNVPKGSYDVVLAESSLHHLSPLESVLRNVERSLRAGGFLIVNEFMGPTRFQWTTSQLAEINRLLAVLPRKYLTEWGRRTRKSKVWRPSRLKMILTDPSEAIESSMIMPLLNSLFDVEEKRGFGGNVLHQLLAQIAHNFLSQDEETRHQLRMCFKAEDNFLTRPGIESDFVVMICRKRHAGISW